MGNPESSANSFDDDRDYELDPLTNSLRQRQSRSRWGIKTLSITCIVQAGCLCLAVIALASQRLDSARSSGNAAGEVQAPALQRFAPKCESSIEIVKNRSS